MPDRQKYFAPARLGLRAPAPYAATQRQRASVAVPLEPSVPITGAVDVVADESGDDCAAPVVACGVGVEPGAPVAGNTLMVRAGKLAVSACLVVVLNQRIDSAGRVIVPVLFGTKANLRSRSP